MPMWPWFGMGGCVEGGWLCAGWRDVIRSAREGWTRYRERPAAQEVETETFLST